MNEIAVPGAQRGSAKTARIAIKVETGPSCPSRNGYGCASCQARTFAFVNRKTSAAALAGLRPAFDKTGSVTAGNASGLNDGAAAVLVMSAQRAAALGLKPLAVIRAYASAGLDPSIMGMGPVPASQRCLKKAGWSAQDLDLMEIEAPTGPTTRTTWATCSACRWPSRS